MRFTHTKALLAAGAALVIGLGAFVWARTASPRTDRPLPAEGETAERTEPDSAAVRPERDPEDGQPEREDPALTAHDDGPDLPERDPQDDEPLEAPDDPDTDGREDGPAEENDPSAGPGGGSDGSVADESGTDDGNAGGPDETEEPDGTGGPDHSADESDPGDANGEIGTADTDSGSAPGGDEPAAGEGSGPGDGTPAAPHEPVATPDDGTGDPAAHTAAVDLPALFSPVMKETDAGTPADLLIEEMLAADPSPFRDEETGFSRMLVYADGDSYEIQTLPEGGVLAEMMYRFPTGQLSRRRDLVYNEANEYPRFRAALAYLFPEQFDSVWNDFATMRHWEEVYLRAYGLEEIDWAAFVRSRFFGARYCRMAVTRDAVTVTVYPAGYRDRNGDFAPDGSYREFYTYPLDR